MRYDATMTTHEDLHLLGVHRTDDTVDVEAVDPAFLLAGLLQTQIVDPAGRFGAFYEDLLTR